MNDSTREISPLRQRMLEDMRLRKLAPQTQASYVRSVRRLAGYLRRPPDTATVEDLRNFQLHLVDRGTSPITLNATISGLKFFFDVTLDPSDLMAKMKPVFVPRTLPVVLSREEVSSLIAATKNLKHQTALSVAYGAGLRANEVAYSRDTQGWRHRQHTHDATHPAGQGRRSLRDDKDHLKKLDPYLRSLKLEAIDMTVLQPFICDRKGKYGVSNATINRALEVVRRILNVAHQEWRWLKGVPKIRMLKEPRRRVRFLRREEADRLIEALPSHMKPIVEFALATGCRAGEILGLEWSRVRSHPQGSVARSWHDEIGRRPRYSLECGCRGGARSDARTAPALVLHFRRQAHHQSSTAWGLAKQRAGIEDFRFHDLRHYPERQTMPSPVDLALFS
jgi:integrase